MAGFGAAITDASAYLIQTKLTPEARKALLTELFSRKTGMGFSTTRVTIGAFFHHFPTKIQSYCNISL